MPPRKKAEDREIEDLKARRKKAQKKNDIAEESKLCNSIGNFYAKKGDCETALHYHRTELSLSEAVDDTLDTAVAHRKVGECLSSLHRYDEAYEHQRQHLKMAKDIGDKVEEQRALATLGRTYYLHSKSDEVSGEEAKELRVNAGNFLLKSLDICNKLSGTHPENELLEMRAKGYINLGLVYEESDDKTSARKFFEKSLEISRELDDDDGTVVRCHLDIGSFHLRNNRPALALRSLRGAVKKVTNRQHCWEQEVEALREMAQAHLLMSNFDQAKISLKKVVKLLQDNSQLAETEEDQRKLNAVRKVIHYSLEMKALGAERAHDKMRMCEKLGDICVNIGAYPAAIKYYKEQLELADAHGLEPKDVSTIIVSLARTHTDCNQYSEAISYYERELELKSDNPADQCPTWMLIGNIRNISGREKPTVMDAFHTAFELAERSKQPKLKADVCRAVLHACRERKMSGRAEWEEKLDDLLKEQPDIPDSGSEEENDCQDIEKCGFATPDSLSELESADYAEEEEEEEEEEESVEIASVKATRTRRENSRKKARLSKRNEKGETMLQVATISGNLSLVRQLILEGADVNLRDHCGWTPLHEACIHGKLDVAMCLLDNGASVNDPGGDHCEGVTPLIDAASAGHLDIVKLLVEKGADLFQTNISGKTAVDVVTATLTERGSSYEMEYEHTAIRDYLVDEMKKRGWMGKVASPSSDVPSSGERRKRSLSISSEDGSMSRSTPTPTSSLSYNQRLRRRGVGDRTGRNVLESDDEEEEETLPVIPPLSRSPSRSREKSSSHGLSRLPSTSSRTQYGAGSIRRDATRTRQLKRPLFSEKPRALISLDEAETTGEYPIIDHWLEDDVGKPQLKKRKSRDPFNLPAPTSSSFSSSSSAPSSSSSSSKLSLNLRGVNKTKSKERVVHNSVGTGSREIEKSRNNEVVMIDSSPTSSSSPPMRFTVNSSATPTTTQPLPLRIRVKIQTRSYLIPCPVRLPDGTESTVRWLADKASERYYSQHGERLTLSLSTSDGALLSSDDVVAHVLASGEEVVAEVKDSQLPPLHERYQTACSISGQECNKGLMEIFQDSTSLAVLNLSRLSLDGPTLNIQPGDLPPLFLSLRRQISLTSITLSGHRLSGETSSLLAGSLALLPNLRILDLSFTGLIPQGLESLCNAQSSPSSCQTTIGPSAQRPWSSLRELVLSNNPLGVGCGPALSSFLSLVPGLLVLGLQDCRLTGATIEGHTGIGHTLRRMSDLSSVDLSLNPLGPSGVISLMHNLRDSRISTLLLANTSTDRPLTQTLQEPKVHHFFQQVSSSLEELDLSHCELDTRVLTQLLEFCELLQDLRLAGIGLTSDTVHPLCRFIESCQSLRELDLTGNEGLGNYGCLQVIQACQSTRKNFKMDIRSCGMTSPLSVELNTLLLQLISEETVKIRFSGINPKEMQFPI